MDRTYTVVLLREAVGGYSVHVPALLGCHTQGEDLPEALGMARESIEMYLEDVLDAGERIPDDVETLELSLRDAREANVFRLSVTVEATAVA